MDLGAGLVLADAVTGLAVDVRVRRLLVHQAVGFAASGTSVSVSYDPMPSKPLAFTACVSPGCCSDAMSGAQALRRSGALALWGQETIGGMGARRSAPRRRRPHSGRPRCREQFPDARPRSPLTRLRRPRPDCSAYQMIESPWRWPAGGTRSRTVTASGRGLESAGRRRTT